MPLSPFGKMVAYLLKGCKSFPSLKTAAKDSIPPPLIDCFRVFSY